jgi:two-component system, LytTR family, response regulator
MLLRVRSRAHLSSAAEVQPQSYFGKEDHTHSAPHRERIVVQSGLRFPIIPTDEIDWIEAANNHVVLHVGKQAHTIRETMARIAKTLDPFRFARVHRSAVVNIQKVRYIEPWSHSEFVLHLASGAHVTTGRTYREVVRKAFGC